MRYQVRAINGNADPGIGALSSTVLGQYDDYEQAKDLACGLAWEHHYGTAVVDTEAQQIDWGSEWTDYTGEETETTK